MKFATLSLAALAASLAAFAVPANANIVVVLNEIYVNPPGTDDNREYIELRGTPNASVSNLTVLEIEGDGSGVGSVDNARPLTGLSLGSNGLLLLGHNYQTSTPWPSIPAATTLANLNRPSTSTIENGAVTFLIVSNWTGTAGSDLDTNNDGIFDSTPWTSIIDSVGWKDAGVGTIFSSAVLSQSSGTSDAATRFPGNDTVNSAAAWYAGDILAGSGSPDLSTAYDPAKASANLPAGGALTPGAANIPTAVVPVPASLAGGTALLGLLAVRKLRRR